jgi:hypothetical protein
MEGEEGAEEGRGRQSSKIEGIFTTEKTPLD